MSTDSKYVRTSIQNDIGIRSEREELLSADVVETMGCSAGGGRPAAWRGDARDWDLDDPDGRPLEVVPAIRDEIERRVGALFDVLEAGMAPGG